MVDVYYLGHSAWVVETDKFYLLFDIQNENIGNGMKLSEGYVDLQLLKDKQVYIFFSHGHHDHCSPSLHDDSKKTGIGTVLQGDVLKPGEKYALGNVTVYTAASTDAGVCFFVQADDTGIFFAGDHADWGDGDSANRIYYEEIDNIAGLGLQTDMAFIPVCTYSGRRPADMTKGAVYAMEKLRPAVTFPMHGNGREHLYQEFEMDLRKAGNGAKVVCAKGKGKILYR
jgi:L-ascorbate metabolism protein UlaG (beta-lactamase superfamily)